MIPLGKASFLIVGLARDCKDTFLPSFICLSTSFSMARKVSFLIIESDSSDGTQNMLHEFSSREQNLDFLTLGNLAERFPSRTERIAFCRNCYLSTIRNSPKYDDIDFVVVADFDGVNSNLTPHAVASCWDRSDWDVCTANQDGPYYDIWALRHFLWSPNDCWLQSRFLEINGQSKFHSIYSSVVSRMICIPPDSEWIEVESAFGGLAIYKKDVILSAHYSGRDQNGLDICEHISLHSLIRQGTGNIFINPRLINYSGSIEHAKYFGLLGVLRLWFRCTIIDALKSF